MSMHEIESLVESSVITVATASPIPPLARNICFNLYQLQNQLDCGYTVLRVREELEKLGYLFLLPPEQLPEPERSAALKLNEKGGFLSDGTYFDHRSGRCCVTAGSLLWTKLIDLGILPESAKTELRELDPLELAELIIPLASKVLAGGDNEDDNYANAADTLGFWYAFFPLFCQMAGMDEEDAPEPERIRALLEMLAVPESFEVLATDEIGKELDDFEEEEMPFLSGWSAPYNEWKNKNNTGDLSLEFCKSMVHDSILKRKFVEADRYASAMEEGPELNRLFHRCLVGMSYYEWVKIQGIKIPIIESVLSQEEAKEGFERVADLSVSSDNVQCARLGIFRILALQGEYAESVEYLNAVYFKALDECGQKSKELLGQSQRAVLVVVYYRMLEMSIPDSFPGKKELMAHKALNGSDLRKSREILSLLLIEKSEHAYAWQQAFSFCDELIKKYGF